MTHYGDRFHRVCAYCGRGWWTTTPPHSTFICADHRARVLPAKVGHTISTGGES